MQEISRKQTQSFETKIIKQVEALPDIHVGLFSPFEDSIIKKYYPIKGGQLAKILGKASVQIYRRAKRLGVRINK